MKPAWAQRDPAHRRHWEARPGDWAEIRAWGALIDHRSQARDDSRIFEPGARVVLDGNLNARLIVRRARACRRGYSGFLTHRPPRPPHRAPLAAPVNLTCRSSYQCKRPRSPRTHASTCWRGWKRRGFRALHWRAQYRDACPDQISRGLQLDEAAELGTGSHSCSHFSCRAARLPRLNCVSPGPPCRASARTAARDRHRRARRRARVLLGWTFPAPAAGTVCAESGTAIARLARHHCNRW
jgi:hypothetical protein